MAVSVHCRIAGANGHAVLAAWLRDPRPRFVLCWRRRHTLLLCLLRRAAGGPGGEPQPTGTVGNVLPGEQWEGIFRFLYLARFSKITYTHMRCCTTAFSAAVPPLATTPRQEAPRVRQMI